MKKCPNCNELTISNFQKVNVSPLSEIECPKCNASITVPWLSLWIKLGYMTFMLICIFSLELELLQFTVLLVCTLGLESFTRFKFVPLILKK